MSSQAALQALSQTEQLSARNFQRLAEFIQDYSGIKMPRRQRYVMHSKLVFARLNLMDDAYPVEKDLDIVFCRNILIHFDKPTQAEVLKRLCCHLRPGGYLFLGHSESIIGIDLPVKQIANTVFQKR